MFLLFYLNVNKQTFPCVGLREKDNYQPDSDVFILYFKLKRQNKKLIKFGLGNKIKRRNETTTTSTIKRGKI